jgi:hypothetical protein
MVAPHTNCEFKKSASLIEFRFILRNKLKSVERRNFFFIYNIHFAAHYTLRPGANAPLAPPPPHNSYAPAPNYS